jgi:outer membrane protein assembly factor BamB
MHKFLSLLSLSIILISCTLAGKENIKSNPENIIWEFNLPSDIYEIDKYKNSIILSTDSNVYCINNDGKLIWEKSINVSSTNSSIKVFNNEIFIAEKDKILQLSPQGIVINEISIKPEPSGNPIILGVDEQNIYILKYGEWYLEAYKIKSGDLGWSIFLDRGGADLFPLLNSGKVLAINTSGIVEISVIDGSNNAYDNSKIYISSIDSDENFLLGIKNEKANTWTLGYLDYHEHKWIWEISQPNEIAYVVEIENVILVNINNKIEAFAKTTGQQLWSTIIDDQINSDPILIQEKLYLKGVNSNSIYVLSIVNGQQMDKIKIDKSNGLIIPLQNIELGIYGIGNYLIVPTGNKLIAFTAN